MIFCGALALGFEECQPHIDGACTNQDLQRGMFEVCELVANYRVAEARFSSDATPAYLPLVGCPFCFGTSLNVLHLAKAPDGDCYFMGCLSEDVSFDHVVIESCPNLTPIGDGGIPDVASPWDMGVPADMPEPTNLDGGV